MEEVVIETIEVKDGNKRFPTLHKLGYDLIAAILSLVVVLLPGIVKYITAGDQAAKISPEIQLMTLLLSLGLAVYAIAKSETGSGSRAIAMVALTACTIRLVLVG
jgi:hypothetical protein